MRFQIVLAAFLGIFIQMTTAARKGSDKRGIQSVDIKNKADSSASSLAVNAAWIGDANSLAAADSTNANFVSQKM
jgi:hypothetical protein